MPAHPRIPPEPGLRFIGEMREWADTHQPQTDTPYGQAGIEDDPVDKARMRGCGAAKI